MAPKKKGKKGKKGKRSTQARVTRVHHRNVDDGPRVSYDAISAPQYLQPRTEGESRSLWAEAVRRVQESKGPAREKYNAEAEYYNDRWNFLTDGSAFPYAQDAKKYWSYTPEGRAFHAYEAGIKAEYDRRADDREAALLIAAQNPYDDS